MNCLRTTLLERGALRGLDPGGISVGELERHDAGLPARCRSLVDARAECRRVDEAVAVVGVAGGAGLPEHELVDVKPVRGDLEQRRAGEGSAGGGDEAGTVLVQVLVVELDVVLCGELAYEKRECVHSVTHEVDLGPNVLVHRHVRSRRKLLVGGHPRGERRVRQDELALRELLAERLGEGGDPRLRCAIALVHGGQVLVVDVDAVELVVEDELCHGVRGADGVRTGGRGLVGLAECGGDDVDACGGVLSLLGRLCGGVKVGVVLHLVPGTGESEEREVDDVPALQNTMC